MIKNFFSLALFAIFFVLPIAGSARNSVSDWYLKDFHSNIIVNTDSSLLITERIIADCGNLPNKHGIFRVLPTAINTDQGKILTPVELVSITDFSGRHLKYSTINRDGTVTWKIGDADLTVSGENEYQIVYRVKNAVRGQADFDELYWNLNGGFWDIQTDAFSADVVFPEGLNGNTVDVEYFSGVLGAKDDSLSKHEWVDSQTLRVSSKRTLFPGEGLTISAVFPKGVMTYYSLGAKDYLPAGWQWFLLPFLVLLICFQIWRKHGDDPNLHRTVIAEYEVPEGLGPMEMGVIMNHGFMDNNFITAAIIKLASDGVLNITETEKTVLLFSVKDYEFSKTNNEAALAELTPGAKAVYEAVFRGMDTVSLSEMKKEFYKLRPDVEEKTKNWLSEQGYMEKKGFKIQAVMFVIGIGLLIGIFSVFKDVLSMPMIVALAASAVIVIIFAAVMAKKTTKGAEVEWKIKGFKLFINTAEKYRAQFFEKENMFEKILPYAIAFGLTKKWISKMRQMYGEEKFNHIAPLWFVSSTGAFNADSFTSSMNSVSTAIATSVSASSGRGGGGFSGGGGGGGGGGGW